MRNIFFYAGSIFLFLAGVCFAKTPLSVQLTPGGELEVTYSNGEKKTYCVSDGQDAIFDEVDGRVTIIAPRYFNNVAGSDGSRWVTIDNYMRVEPNAGARVEDTSGAYMGWQVNFAEPGVKYLWLRGAGITGEDDSVHFGFDGEKAGTVDFFGISALGYSNRTRDDQVVKITVDTPGPHTIDVWAREDGFILESIEISKDAQFRPE